MRGACGFAARFKTESRLAKKTELAEALRSIWQTADIGARVAGSLGCRPARRNL